MQAKADTVLGTVASVAAGVLLLLAALSATLVFSPAVATGLGLVRPERGYVVGAYIDAPSASYDRGRLTVLVFARSTCSACQSAKSAIRRLAEAAARASETRLALIAPGPSSPDGLKFASDIGLAPSAVYFVAEVDTKVRLVPTTAVVDHRGKILFYREGPPTEQDEAAVTKLLASEK